VPILSVNPDLPLGLEISFFKCIYLVRLQAQIIAVQETRSGFL